MKLHWTMICLISLVVQPALGWLPAWWQVIFHRNKSAFQHLLMALEEVTRFYYMLALVREQSTAEVTFSQDLTWEQEHYREESLEMCTYH